MATFNEVVRRIAGDIKRILSDNKQYTLNEIFAKRGDGMSYSFMGYAQGISLLKQKDIIEVEVTGTKGCLYKLKEMKK